MIILALQLIVASAEPITQASAVQAIFTSLSGDAVLALLVGALFAMVSYSSLAAVLLTATLSATGLVPLHISLAIVIGSNLGSGFLAMLSSRGQNAVARQVVLGSMLFKLIGCVLVLPWVKPLALWVGQYNLPAAEVVIYFHVVYNLVRCVLMLALVKPMARLCQRLIAEPEAEEDSAAPRYLDQSALDTPSLALANAVRETLRLGDVIEQMLQRFDSQLAGKGEQKRLISHLEEEAEMLHSSIKLYLAQLQQTELGESDSRRWAEVIDTAMSLQQSSLIIGRMSHDVANQTADPQRVFSKDGYSELTTMMSRLQNNLNLAMSVFVSGDVDNARRLRRAKHRFRLLNQRYSFAHVERLHVNNLQSIGSSRLHIGLLGDMKRLNSLFCSVAYHVLEGVADIKTETTNDDTSHETA
ncbi:Na/Pi cotransporter family protein [Morganella morganii]|uniref:Na/Pi cotransporter family protein n=1 Tax=Morganella morganii TaxID=582 RepID=UPI003C12C735